LPESILLPAVIVRSVSKTKRYFLGTDLFLDRRRYGRKAL
jgi:hypothetical protein